MQYIPVYVRRILFHAEESMEPQTIARRACAATSGTITCNLALWLKVMLLRGTYGNSNSDTFCLIPAAAISSFCFCQSHRKYSLQLEHPSDLCVFCLVRVFKHLSVLIARSVRHVEIRFFRCQEQEIVRHVEF